MEFETKEIENKGAWENFLRDGEEKTFLQSWNWGEFQKMMGNKIWRFGIYNNEQRTENKEQLLGVALTIKISAKRGTFLFVPHGPAMKHEVGSTKYEVLRIFLEELKEIAEKEKCDFIRIAPVLERNDENIKIFKNLRFREAPIHIHPELTWELDIMKPEDELLMRMRKTTRYLIRQAQKNKEIEIIKSEDLKDLEEFNKLYQATVDRHHFVPFSFDYLKNEFLAFSPDNQILIFLGKYRGEVVSAGIFLFWQGIGFYHHGASSLKYPKIPVSYLLLWEAIKEAQRRGCRKFNFWGIAPITSDFKIQTSNHPWAGLTLFKMGFGGYKKEYLKTQDLPLSKKYWLNFVVEMLRKKKRNL
jgi:lipid II:glycine glycyltransferase (peptidoglycan interpeptide bridge formation enzyme)